MSGIALAEVHAASCLCGQVRLRVHGAPNRVGLYHCLDCRKAHAADFVASVIFPTLNVDITDPEGRALADDRLGSFSRDGQYLRFFCKACGSHVYGRSKGADEIELHLGSFDETNLWTPTYEAWAKRRERWIGDLPTVFHHYPGNRENGPHDVEG